MKSQKRFIAVLLSSLLLVGYQVRAQDQDRLENCAEDPEREKYGYIALIDAGSSGSRVYLFFWQKSPTQYDLPDLTPVRDAETGHELNMRVEPGISDSRFKSAPQAVASLKPLLNYLKMHLSPNELAVTHIYLNATGGMRLLDLEQRREILSEVRSLFILEG